MKPPKKAAHSPATASAPETNNLSGTSPQTRSKSNSSPQRPIPVPSANFVAELRDLLGHDVLLLAWPKGSKGLPKKWGHLTVAHMTPAYLANLADGNIGVALGSVSGGLVALDVDDDALIEPFLKANPSLADTLQTHGARGRVFWLRMVGSYPDKTKKLKIHSGGDAGEFRSNGSQSIIHGIHPNGHAYQMLNKAKPVPVNFADIVWPPEISNPPATPQWTEEHISHSASSAASAPSVASAPSESSVTSASSAASASSVHSDWVFSIRTVEDALRVAMPDRVHENNHCLFILARAVKALEMQGAIFAPKELVSVFNRWHAAAARFLRPGLSKEDYLTEFLSACHRAKYPLGSLNTIPKAWALAQKNSLPPAAFQFENPQLRLLVALCRELQIINGDKPFYLSSRTCKDLFGHASHTTAAKWLDTLCTLKILKKVKKGDAKRASRYHYQLPISSD